ncbi:MAG: cytidylate kinase [Frankiales bacterium]|nr:cytidylate kinase [Frankiales bacterium]
MGTVGERGVAASQQQSQGDPPRVGNVPAPGTAAPSVDELVRVVALDGPAGSGKSTVARLTAERLGWRFVDTGATYRAVALAVLRAGADPEDAEACTRAAQAADIELRTDPTGTGVLLNGVDVSRDIRTPEVTAAVSAVSSHPGVRAVLIQLQRRAMGTAGAVVEGRDIATVVAPQAAVKVYLDARPEVRAARRAGEQAPRVVGLGPALESTRDALLARDERDNQTNRLAPSGGALHLDTSDLSLEQVVAAVAQLAVDAGLATVCG